MAHVSLYRKYRSQTFDEVIGQEHITTTLAHALAEDRLHHAYLFTGPRGTGKTSTARILAKAVNCAQGPTPTPCGRCQQCVAITAGTSVDVIEIDAASHGGVDDVRDLRDRVAFPPVSGRMKVYIVDECHMLSTAGWNAFLKTVEEPPGHVLFVFATTEPHKVLDTILSRTQRFDFKRIPAPVLLEHCRGIARAEGLTVGEGALELVVRAGDGSARDTLSVLDQVMTFTGREITSEGVGAVLGTVGDDLLAEAVEALARGDVAGVCLLVARLADGGQDLRQFAKDAVEHLRALLLLQVAPEAGLVDATVERLAAMRAAAQRLGRVEVLRAIELLGEAQAQMRRGNTRLPLEVALIKAALPEASGDPAAIAARMDRLERRTGVDLPVDQDPIAPDRTPLPTPAAAAPDAAAPDAAAPASDGRPAAASTPGPPPAAAGPAQAPPAQPPAEPADEPLRSVETSDTRAPQGGRRGSVEGRPAGDAGRPAPAAGRPAAEGSRVDLDLVTRSWPAVVEAVKQRSRRLHAFLIPGRPTAVDGDQLTLAFGPTSGFHAEQCASEEWQGALREVFAAVLGAPLRVRCTVSDGEDPAAVVVEEDPQEVASRQEAEAVLETEAQEAAGELPDEREVHDLAVETLTRDLGAVVVDDS